MVGRRNCHLTNDKKRLCQKQHCSGASGRVHRKRWVSSSSEWPGEDTGTCSVRAQYYEMFTNIWWWWWKGAQKIAAHFFLGTWSHNLKLWVLMWTIYWKIAFYFFWDRVKLRCKLQYKVDWMLSYAPRFQCVFPPKEGILHNHNMRINSVN